MKLVSIVCFLFAILFATLGIIGIDLFGYVLNISTVFSWFAALVFGVIGLLLLSEE